MALFPSASAVKASFDNKGSKAIPSNYWVSSAVEPAKKIELYSPEFYAACVVGGIFGK